MPAVHGDDRSIRAVFSEGLGSGPDEGGIVFAPHGQKRRAVLAQVLLELRVERDIRAVIEDQIRLHLSVAGLHGIKQIELITVGSDAAFRCAKGVLADDGLTGKGVIKFFAQFFSGIFPVGGAPYCKIG